MSFLQSRIRPCVGADGPFAVVTAKDNADQNYTLTVANLGTGLDQVKSDQAGLLNGGTVTEVVILTVLQGGVEIRSIIRPFAGTPITFTVVTSRSDLVPPDQVNTKGITGANLNVALGNALDQAKADQNSLLSGGTVTQVTISTKVTP